ncbi:MAG: hypothetical protein Q8R08_00245 [bacterium]|nr:hypothetical protein [bacterium]
MVDFGEADTNLFKEPKEFDPEELAIALEAWEAALRESLGTEYSEEEIRDLIRIMGPKEARKLLDKAEPELEVQAKPSPPEAAVAPATSETLRPTPEQKFSASQVEVQLPPEIEDFRRLYNNATTSGDEKLEAQVKALAKEHAGKFFGIDDPMRKRTEGHYHDFYADIIFQEDGSLLALPQGEGLYAVFVKPGRTLTRETYKVGGVEETFLFSEGKEYDGKPYDNYTVVRPALARVEGNKLVLVKKGEINLGEPRG